MKYSKVISKIAIGMIMGGFILAGIGYAMGGKTMTIRNNFVNITLDDTKRVIKNQNIENFKNIDIDVDLDSIELIKSNENKIELNYSESLNKVDYKVENETLTIKQNPVKSIGININLASINDRNLNYIKLYISDESIIDDIKILSKYGDINMTDINSKSIDLKCDYGNTKLNNINSDKINIHIEDGDANIDNLEVADIITMNNSYGKISVSNSKFNNLVTTLNDGNLEILNTISENSNIKNKYGNIKFLNMLSQGLEIECNDGDVNIIGAFKGNTIVNNKYGNIKIISSESESLYDYSIVNKYGEISINNEKIEGSIIKNNNAKHNLNISCSDGSIDINFEN